jgi:hypothetical protein
MSMYEAIAGSIATRGVDGYSKHPDTFDLPPGVESSLAVFLSVPGIGDKVAAALGTPKQQGQKGKPPSQVEHGAGTSFAPKSQAMESGVK